MQKHFVFFIKSTVVCFFRIGRRGFYLEIINANQDDEGMYTCQATNRAGTDSASVQWVFTGSLILLLYILLEFARRGFFVIFFS